MHIIKNTRFITGAVGIAFIFSLFGGATLTHAALTQPQINAITSLLQAFNVDSSTIANVQAVLEKKTLTATVAPTTAVASSTPNQTSGKRYAIKMPNGGTCSKLSKGLSRGSTDQKTGGDVSRLQSFLSKDKSVYPGGWVTGYFGDSTEKAVQRWQAQKNIVSSGDAQSTGYGNIGPRTRGEMDREMEVECENGDSQNSSDTTKSSESETKSHSENRGSTSTASSTSSDSQKEAN